LRARPTATDPLPLVLNALFSADELAIFEAKLCGVYPIGTFPQFMSLRKESGWWTTGSARAGAAALRNTPTTGLRLDMDHPGHHLLLFETCVLRTSCAYVFWPVFCSFG
jgi:hypothetical protein